MRVTGSDVRRFGSSLVDRWRARPRGLRPELPAKPNLGGWFWWSNGWGTQDLPGVTEPILLGLPAAWRCVQLISNAVGQMTPMRQLDADGRTEIIPPSPVVVRPNSTYGVTEFWAMAVAHAVCSGNFVGLPADEDPQTGFPRQVIPVNSAAVTCYYDPDGFVRYDIGDLRGLRQDDVVHVRGHVIPGTPWGIGVVEAFRRSIGEKADQQNFAASTYTQSGVPAGIIKPGLLSLEGDTGRAQAEAIQDRWIERFAGGNRRPAVLPPEWEFTPLAWSPQDMEFLESRKFSVAELALMFNLDPGDLGVNLGGSSLTYANLQQRQSARVIDSYGPWIARFEDAWSDLIPGGNLARFRRGNYIHASRKDQIDELAAAIAAGIITEDEAREELNLPPLPAPDPPPPPLVVPALPPPPAELPPGPPQEPPA